jgi:hypothetical protein
VVQYSEGGRTCGIKLPSGEGGKGGGKRGIVEEFSSDAQRRLLRLVNSFDQRAHAAKLYRFITLTYPKEFPAARATKTHLDAVIKRFERQWGPRGLVWKLEAQRRGAPHYHLLLLMGSEATLQELNWWAENWCEVIGEPLYGDCWKVHMGAAGGNSRQCVEAVRDWNGVAVYCGKYLAKPCGNTDEWQAPGRWWGVRRRELLPIETRVEDVDREVGIKARRVLRKLYERQSTGWCKLLVDRKGRWVPSPSSPRITVKDARRWQGEEWCKVVPIRRRWRSSRGGINIFMDYAEFLRVVGWAMTECGCDTCDVDGPVPF